MSLFLLLLRLRLGCHLSLLWLGGSLLRLRLLALNLFLLAQVITLRLISADAVVSLVIGRNGSRSLKVLEQILALMGFKLAANFHTVDTLARLMLLNCLGSFHLGLGFVLVLETLELHPSKP